MVVPHPARRVPRTGGPSREAMSTSPRLALRESRVLVLLVHTPVQWKCLAAEDVRAGEKRERATLSDAGRHWACLGVQALSVRLPEGIVPTVHRTDSAVASESAHGSVPARLEEE